MATASAALVYDNSFFGATSPSRPALPARGGSDCRFASVYTLLADYRQYFMPVRPFTIAARLLHYGRYGRDAEDSTLMFPIYMGYQSLVRGYD